MPSDPLSSIGSTKTNTIDSGWVLQRQARCLKRQSSRPVRTCWTKRSSSRCSQARLRSRNRKRHTRPHLTSDLQQKSESGFRTVKRPRLRTTLFPRHQRSTHPAGETIMAKRFTSERGPFETISLTSSVLSESTMRTTRRLHRTEQCRTGLRDDRRL